MIFIINFAVKNIYFILIKNFRILNCNIILYYDISKSQINYTRFDNFWNFDLF